MRIPIKQYLTLFSKYLKNQWFQVFLLMLLLTGTIGLQLFNPQIIRVFIDSTIKGVSAQALTVTALTFIGLAILQQIFIFTATYLSQKIGWKATNQLRNDLAEHCLSLDMTFHKKYQSGELIERIDGDVTALFNFFAKFLLHVLSNIVLIFGILIVLFFEDWRIGLGLTFFVTVALIALVKMQSIAVPHFVKVREITAKFFGFIGEQLTNTEDIRSNGAIEHSLRKFYDFIRRYYPLQRRAALMNYTMWTTTLGIFTLGNVVTFGVGGYLWSKGIITIGTVYLVFHYTELLNQPLEQIRTQLGDLQQARASIARIEELFSIQSKLAEKTGSGLPDETPTIKVDNISFEYEKDIPVLHNLSFQLTPGKVLGVLGRTGSGKTTLARLLMRFYDPKDGVIYFGSCDIKSVSLVNLRQKMGYVTQDVQLFHASIRDNLTFFDQTVPDEQIITVLEVLGLGNWYDSLPNKLDTILEGDGGGLSAGEAQLLAFVRVFLKNPDFVILDEASSRLDPATEQLIEGAIAKLLKGRTGLIIAHRLQTVQRTDEILILEQGRIIEYGQRQKLASDPDSHFYQLLQKGIEEVLV